MSERETGVEGELTVRLGCVRGRLRDPETLGGPPLKRGVAGRISRRYEQQTPRVARQPRKPAREALLDARGERQRRGQAEPAGELRRRQAAWQLQEGERISVRLDDDPLQHTLVEARRQDRVQQRPRISTAERLDVKLREAGERLDRLPRREDHRDLLGQKAAGHERQHTRRRTVEPLRIVDDTEERLLVGRLRQQVEDREPDEERIRRPARAQPERNFQGVALGIRQALHEVETRRAQLVERRERKFHLPLDSDRAGDPEARSRFDRIVEQRGLTDARLPVDRQHAALPVARRRQHAVEHVALALPSEQLHRGCPDDHSRSMPPGSWTTGFTSRTRDFTDAIARPRMPQCLPYDRS